MLLAHLLIQKSSPCFFYIRALFIYIYKVINLLLFRLQAIFPMFWTTSCRFVIVLFYTAAWFHMFVCFNNHTHLAALMQLPVLLAPLPWHRCGALSVSLHLRTHNGSKVPLPILH